GSTDVSSSAATTGTSTSANTSTSSGETSTASSSAAGTGGAGTGGATSSSSSSSASSGAGTGGGQATQPLQGVATSPCAARTALNVSWYYNWEQTETEPCKNGQGGEFVPMIWGHTGSEQSATGIQTSIASFVSKGYKYVLGFNEPDNTGQSN